MSRFCRQVNLLSFCKTGVYIADVSKASRLAKLLIIVSAQLSKEKRVRGSLRCGHIPVTIRVKNISELDDFVEATNRKSIIEKHLL